MSRRKRGTLKSVRHAVRPSRSRKQAIAIGLSERAGRAKEFQPHAKVGKRK